MTTPKFQVRKSVLWIIFMMTIYYAVMELYWYFFVGVSYARYHMEIDINVVKYVESKILFFAIMALSFFIYRKSEFIFAVFVFFSIFFFVPGLITYSFQDQVGAPTYATVGLMLGIAFISTLRFRIPVMVNLNFSRGMTMLIISVCLLPVLINFGFYLNLNNLLLDDIDETRQLFGETSSVLINYLYTWFVRVVIPVLMIYFLIRKQYRYALINFLILFYLYIISGEKTFYITVLMVLFFYFVGRDYVEKAKYLLVWLVIGLLVSPFIDEYVFELHKLKGTFVMRMLFLPSHLNYFYFDLFEGKPLYFAESNFFKWFFDYPYDRPVGYVISEMYFQAPDMNSNNGIISDGYMNLGYIGIVINILIVSLLFLFFNSVRVDPRYLGIFFLLVFLLLSSPMLSMFITSGLWLLIPLSVLVMRQNERQLA